ncbi:MAG: DUF2007 domain-containing protein [Candidatus Eisenbacteria bacterium]|nr:DUF2007 domain-containing protein [Candidatus Eisenbacteria bacterium]
MTDDFVTIAAFASAVEAQNCRAALAHHGIETRLGDEYLVATDWLYSVGVGGVKVRVGAADVDRARQVLLSARPAAVTCPECGSPRTRRELPSRAMLLAMPVMFAFGLPFVPFWMRRWNCADCGTSWKSRFEAEEPRVGAAGEAAAGAAPPSAAFEVPEGAFHVALAPWRWKEWCLRGAMGVAALAFVLGGGLGAWVLLAAPAAGAGFFALAAIFSWRWEQVTLTRGALWIDDPEGRREFPVEGLREGTLEDGSPALLGVHGPLLAVRDRGAAPRGTVLLTDEDLEEILSLVRGMRHPAGSLPIGPPPP